MNQRTKEPAPFIGVKPYIGLYADKSCIIEQAGELLFFDDASVVIRTSDRTVRVMGRNLQIVCLSSGALAVTGVITSVAFE